MSTTDQQPSSLVPPEAVARTYTNRVYEDPWEAVCDYREVVQWAAENPSEGATGISNRFDLPRGRVEAWLGDSRPNSVRGIQVAEDRGWIAPLPSSERFRGLNALLAWVLQSGSITTETWVPFFTVGSDRDRQLLSAAANMAGLTLDVTRSASALRSQEMRPIEDGSVLGRVLVVLGAPRGAVREEGQLTLPSYLDRVPERYAQEFVQLYIHNLGQNRDDRFIIHLRPSHSVDYLQSVAALVKRLTDDPVRVIENNIILSKPATREVAVWDPLLGIE
ncbi:MAG: hypothetical protein U5J98_08050 [Halobacteriales archaeon]|nr:hypothetical protein [Halobacteriales archaeon]